MKSLIKATSLLAISLIIIGLTACGPEDPNGEIINPKEESRQTIDPIEPEQNIVVNSSIEKILLETPHHISKIFSENFTVEADVHVPNVKETDILLAKYMPFDEQKLLSIFFKEKIPFKSSTSYDDSILYEDDNSYLSINNGFISYTAKDFEYVKFPTDSFVASSDVLSHNRRFNEIYTQKNLGFMAKEEVFKTVSDLLMYLNVDIMDDVEIYAIDSGTMQIQQRDMIQKEIDIQKEMGISPIQDPTAGYQTKDKFTQDDDFYILFLKMEQNKIPITQNSYIIQANERALNGSTARVSFSQEGIIQLYLKGVYQQQGTDKSPSTIISIEEAIQKIYEKHNSIISTDKVIITAIDFEYVPVPYNKNYDEVKLIPAWCLTSTFENTINKPSKDGKENSQLNIGYGVTFINAITGEEIQ